MNIQYDLNNVRKDTKSDKNFPFKTGNLKNSTHFQKTNDGFKITVDLVQAPYGLYLDLGTRPHDIPHAFGRPLPFGIGGRFNGMFHPGSKKHKNWVENVILYDTLRYYMDHYKGVIKYD